MFGNRTQTELGSRSKVKVQYAHLCLTYSIEQGKNPQDTLSSIIASQFDQ